MAALLIVELLVLALLVLVLVFAIFQLLSLQVAPFVPSKAVAIEEMLDLGGVSEASRVVDFGSGMGDICFAAAKRGARATGVELNPMLVAMSCIIAMVRHEHRVRFVCANMFRYQAPKNTDVVLLYLLPYSVQRVWEKLVKELPSGTKVVTNAFALPQLPCAKQNGSALLYLIP